MKWLDVNAKLSHVRDDIFLSRREKVFANTNIRNPDCKRCALHQSTTNVCIMGRGPITAPIMMIGEAPGRAEAETGQPFMGESGKRILQPAIDRWSLTDQVYITNVCKCRPPHNRTPLPTERKACSELYLSAEIRLVNPLIIVLMGNTPYEAMEPKNQRCSRHKFYMADIEGSKRFVIWTWHPAYCHRAGVNITRQFDNDVHRVSRLNKQLTEV